MAKRNSSPGEQGSPRAERYSDNPFVRELLDHVAEELAKEYISLMKETAAKPKERKDS